MPSECSFNLDHPNGVYYSGQTINGTIKLKTTKDKNVRHVRIVFLGEGKVKWDESYTTTDANGNSTTHTTYYRSHEVYVNNETLVRGEGPLPVGVYAYTFHINLPVLCPTSCEGKYGHIRYMLSLILDRPFRFNNVYNIPLTILQTVDLNLNPIFKVPLLAEENASLCYWNCASGKMIYSLKTPFGAYAPGQNIKYSLFIKNQSMVNTTGYMLEFSQKMTFTAQSPSRKQRHAKKVLVLRSSSESCLRLTNRIMEGTFCIPSVPPTTDPGCIIYVQYKLKITIHISGCHSSKDISLPIFIGNIPLRESLASCHEAEGAQSTLPEISPTAPEKQDVGGSDMPPSYQDLRPPSYEATMQSDSPFVDHDVDEHHRVVGFRPLYPMYK